MTNTSNFETIERNAGNVARASLQASYLSQIRRTFRRGKTGKLEKSSVRTKYRSGWLDRLILVSPKYSFQEHFGSNKTGTQKETQRRAGNVKSFIRHRKGKSETVRPHRRSGGSVKAFNKNRRYTAKDHITRALRNTNALEVLATSLGENRIVLVASQINF